MRRYGRQRLPGSNHQLITLDTNAMKVRYALQCYQMTRSEEAVLHVRDEVRTSCDREGRIPVFTEEGDGLLGRLRTVVLEGGKAQHRSTPRARSDGQP